VTVRPARRCSSRTTAGDSPEDVARVFEPILAGSGLTFRRDRPWSRNRGMDRAISGGQIGAENRPQGGRDFRVTIPESD